MRSEEFVNELSAKKKEGKKIFIAFLTAGIRADWIEIGQMFFSEGVDAVEVGIPFSDPMIDGPVIQKANQLAFENHINLQKALSDGSKIAATGPSVVMTYYNIIYRTGLERFAGFLENNGFAGSIVPDLSYEESLDWREISHSKKLANILLVAPTTSDERLKEISDSSDGFIYMVSTMGVTGERSQLDPSALKLSSRVKMITDKVRVIGIGVSNQSQVAEACEAADGFVMGSTIIRKIIEGQSLSELAKFIKTMRSAAI